MIRKEENEREEKEEEDNGEEGGSGCVHTSKIGKRKEQRMKRKG